MKRIAILASLCAVLAFSPFSPSALAQDSCPGGFGFGAPHAIGPFDAYATLQDGTRVVSDGVSVDHVDANGALILHLGGYAIPVFASLVLLAPDESFALVGESSNGFITRFALDGSGQANVGNVFYNYDALWEDAGHVLFSADTSGGFANQVVRLDIASGATTIVAQLTGSSGPIARRASTGELFVGLVDFAQPNADSILRYSAAQLSSGVVLQPSDAQVFASALPTVAALRVDERYDVPGLGFWRLYVALAPFGSPSTIACFAPGGTRLADVVSSPDSISTLELRRGNGAGCVGPWQPDAGEQLSYRGTQFCFPNCSTAEVRTLVPRRPQTSIHGPGLSNPGGGNVTVDVDGCPPNANLLLLTGPQPLYSPNEQTRVHPDGFLWHSGLAWVPLRRLVTLRTNAAGHATFTYFNPGTLNGTHAFQALVRDSNGIFVGSSTSVLN